MKKNILFIVATIAFISISLAMNAQKGPSIYDVSRMTKGIYLTGAEKATKDTTTTSFVMTSNSTYYIGFSGSTNAEFSIDGITVKGEFNEIKITNGSFNRTVLLMVISDNGKKASGTYVIQIAK